MIRLFTYILLSLAVTAGAAWIIGLPGMVSIQVGAYRLEPSFGMAALFIIGLVIVSIAIWAIIRRILEAPRKLAQRNKQKRREVGYEAIADGFIALQAGDPATARTLAKQAQARLPDHAGAQLLEARSELALGDLKSAREHYRALIANPKTAIAALSGLYEQARTQGRHDAALTFATKANTLSAQLEWAQVAVFDDLTTNFDWTGALDMLSKRSPSNKDQRLKIKHQRAILHTAIANQNQETDAPRALEQALAALKLEPNLVPAALIAARIHINRGDSRKAQSLLRRIWRTTHHPHIGLLHANSQPGTSAVDRLKRTKQLVEATPENIEAAQVLARAAIDAYEWVMARNALAPYSAENSSQVICLLMAEIEEGQSGDLGKAREWLSRAVQAPRDKIWVADGMISKTWEPVSPLTGKLDAFVWQAPAAQLEPRPNPTQQSEPDSKPENKQLPALTDKPST